MIAELNSVVPTFDVTVDAPTPLPIPPYYDSDNSNLYYKLHVQPAWGLRVRAAKPLEIESTESSVEYPSDVSGGYATGLTADKRAVISETNRPLAIYFNKDGFNQYQDVTPSFDKDIINFAPTGKGYRGYYQGNKNLPDTYELSVMLPSFGTAVADM